MLPKFRRIFIISVLFLISVVTNYGQNQPDASEILVKIEQGFQTGNENKISEFIDSKTYFSFTADLAGYYSY